MFRQFSCRLIPFALGLIPAFVLGLIPGAPVRRGEGASAEATDPDVGAEVAAAGLDVAVADPPDRGDVPGWVLITLMTAGLVVALWALAGEAFTSMFQDAMNKVRGAG